MSNISRYDLFWWLGVLHTDCYVCRKDGEIRELRLRVGENSLEMLIKWKIILDSLTGKSHRISEERHHDKRYDKNRISFCVRESSKTVINALIKGLPDTIHMKKEGFGAYLAGIIDGDGCIQIRKRHFDKGFERLVKIVGESTGKLVGLQEMLINENLPKGYITEYKNHSDLWIYINKDFSEWLVSNVAPHISIKRKLIRIVPRKRLLTDADCPGREQRNIVARLM